MKYLSIIFLFFVFGCEDKDLDQYFNTIESSKEKVAEIINDDSDLSFERLNQAQVYFSEIEGLAFIVENQNDPSFKDQLAGFSKHLLILGFFEKKSFDKKISNLLKNSDQLEKICAYVLTQGQLDLFQSKLYDKSGYFLGSEEMRNYSRNISVISSYINDHVEKYNVPSCLENWNEI